MIKLIDLDLSIDALLEEFSGSICKSADPIEGEWFGLTEEEAADVYRYDPSLLYLEDYPFKHVTIDFGVYGSDLVDTPRDDMADVVRRYLNLLHERLRKLVPGMRFGGSDTDSDLQVSGCVSVLMKEEIEELVRFQQDALTAQPELWLED